MELRRGSARLTFQLGPIVEYKLQLLWYTEKKNVVQTNIKALCLEYCILGQTRIVCIFNPLKTKRRLLYLKTQFVPRSKHFSSRL